MNEAKTTMMGRASGKAKNLKSLSTAAWRFSQAALFAGAMVGSLINLRALRTGGVILLAAATAEAGQPLSTIDFSAHSNLVGATSVSEGALLKCQGAANKFGDGTGSGDYIDPACIQAYYLKANPSAVRTSADVADFAFGFRNILFMRTPQVTLTPNTHSPGMNTRSVNTSRLADVIVAGGSSKLQEIQAVALDPSNEEVHVLDASGLVLSFPLGVGGNLAPLRSFSALDPSDVSSLAVDTVSDEIILVRTGKARLDFHSRRADVDGHQAYSSTGPIRSLAGSNTGLVGPVDAAVAEQAGELIVLDRAANQVLIYGSSASGNTAPKRAIRGALTGLSNPQAISYSSSADQIVVWNGNGSSLVFPRTGSGDVPPITTP